jgi:hypothetical protein
LSGTIKFPRRRPPKRGLYWEKQALAERVWEAKKANGWKKISSAIELVAGEEKCSPRTIWDCWKVFDPAGYEIRREEAAFDAMLDAANEARAEAALEWLKENEGDCEFTDEEIADAAHELDQEDWRDHDDY